MRLLSSSLDKWSCLIRPTWWMVTAQVGADTHPLVIIMLTYGCRRPIADTSYSCSRSIVVEVESMTTLQTHFTQIASLLYWTLTAIGLLVAASHWDIIWLLWHSNELRRSVIIHILLLLLWWRLWLFCLVRKHIFLRASVIIFICNKASCSVVLGVDPIDELLSLVRHLHGLLLGSSSCC